VKTKATFALNVMEKDYRLPEQPLVHAFLNLFPFSFFFLCFFSLVF